MADGWYSGYIGYLRQRDHYGKKPRFRGELHLEFADGTTADIASGKDWKASAGAIREADFLMGETFDARRAISGRDAPKFDDAKWDSVVVGAEMNPKVQRIRARLFADGRRSLPKTSPKRKPELMSSIWGRTSRALPRCR